jgi:hypothetical protein
MYLQLNDTAGTSAVLGDGQRLVKYHRAGLSAQPPDARYWPGRTDLESHLKNANTFRLNLPPSLCTSAKHISSYAADSSSQDQTRLHPRPSC